MQSSQRTIWLLTLGFFFNWCGFDGAQQYLVPLFQNHRQAHGALLALILIYATFFLTNLVAPALIARLGVKVSLLLGAIPYSLFLFAAGGPSISWLYGAAVAVGIGAALLWNASAQVVAAASEPTAIGANMGKKYAALQLGGLIGVASGGLLLHYLAESQLFVVFGLISLLGIICFSLIKISNRATSSDDHQPDFGYLLRPQILLLAPLVVAGYYVMIQAFGAFTLIATSLFGLKTFGLIATILSLGTILGSFSLGKSADRYSKIPLLIGLIGLGLTSLLMITQSIAFWSMILGAFLMGFFFSSIYPVTQALLHERVSQGTFHKAIGAFQVYNTAGMLAGLVAAQVLAPRLSYLPAAILLVIAVPTILIFERNYPRPQ